MSGEEVEIVKMDATANDVADGFQLQGFPSIFWLPSRSQRIVAYEGARTFKDFIKFIAKESFTELKGYNRTGRKKNSEL